VFGLRFTPARKRPFRVRAMVASGMLRAARRTAEADRCAVAEGLFALAGFGSIGASASSPGRFKKALDVTGTAAGAASAIIDCQARARASKMTADQLDRDIPSSTSTT
jgi:hypothetical protein